MAGRHNRVVGGIGSREEDMIKKVLKGEVKEDRRRRRRRGSRRTLYLLSEAGWTCRAFVTCQSPVHTWSRNTSPLI